jgi:soluble lytic murein transglycosylase-like protein
VNFLLVGVIAAAAVGALVFSRKGDAMETKPPQSAAPQKARSIDDIFRAVGEEYGVPPALLKAIAIVESSMDARAVNPRDNESIGLMQILCKPDGKGGCGNRFDIDGWETITREKLFDPETNIRMGAQILKWNLDTYGYPKGVAVYNAWDQRFTDQNGPFKNADYVSKVVAHYGRLANE